MRPVVIACLAYAAIADPVVGQSANAMGKSFLPAAAPHKAPVIPSGIAAPIPVGSSNPVHSPPAVWKGLHNIEGEIHNLEAQNAAMQMEIDSMKTQLETMEGAESYQPASAQDQWSSGKFFMGFGAFGLGGALMYSILQKLFPSNRNRHYARAVPLMSMSTPSGAEMQQVDLIHSAGGVCLSQHQTMSKYGDGVGSCVMTGVNPEAKHAALGDAKSRTGDLKMSVSGDAQDFDSKSTETSRRTLLTTVAAGVAATMVPAQKSDALPEPGKTFLGHKEEIPEVSKLGYDVSPLSWKEVNEEAEDLTDFQRSVAFQRATEKPFTGKTINGYAYNDKTPGYYIGAISGLPLFSTKQRFDSGTGWPSFWAPVDAEHVDERLDPEDQRYKFSYTFPERTVRTEVLDAASGAHLGHVFDDGPEPTGKRYCINAAALFFVPAKGGVVPIETKWAAYQKSTASASGAGKATTTTAPEETEEVYPEFTKIVY